VNIEGGLFNRRRGRWREKNWWSLKSEEDGVGWDAAYAARSSTESASCWSALGDATAVRGEEGGSTTPGVSATVLDALGSLGLVPSGEAVEVDELASLDDEAVSDLAFAATTAGALDFAELK
jgi:hypothetical protein